MSRTLLVCTLLMLSCVGCSNIHFYWEPYDPAYDDYDTTYEDTGQEQGDPSIPACYPGAYTGKRW